MTETIEIKQQATRSEGSTQIGVQNNYQGLTATDAFQMACQMFQEYYPRLREDVVNELTDAVVNKLQSVPPENIEPPSPRIAIPALQNATITEEVTVRDLYAELLAKSMNTSTKDGVHPGFVDIIRQLCSDEAKLLKYLKKNTMVPTIAVKYENAKQEGVYLIKKFSNIGEKSGCERPYEIGKYFDNLIRLGLLKDADEMYSFTNKAVYTPLKNHRFITALMEKRKPSEPNNIVSFKESCVELTDFGRSFCRICICADNK